MSILVEEASTSKAKGKVPRHKKRKRNESSSTFASTSSASNTPPGGGKWKRKMVR
ncbi:UNVERIFIED_CONTAM: hypothetical protein Sradi_5846000 [Sesamum radiatum]|uniref:Uncharacterized protein n=1 Tax=Sesamum radiatum TaxID=300843 RepID=A0AAW2KT49_SESRA